MTVLLGKIAQGSIVGGKVRPHKASGLKENQAIKLLRIEKRVDICVLKL